MPTVTLLDKRVIEIDSITFSWKAPKNDKPIQWTYGIYVFDTEINDYGKPFIYFFKRAIHCYTGILYSYVTLVLCRFEYITGLNYNNFFTSPCLSEFSYKKTFSIFSNINNKEKKIIINTLVFPTFKTKKFFNYTVSYII